MAPQLASTARRMCVLACVFGLGATACGGSDDAASSASEPAAGSSPTNAVSETSTSDDTGDAASFTVAGDLVVPLDYLQGPWCNTDGEAWLIDGDTGRFGVDHDELLGELPVSVAFADSTGTVLALRSDDEFVLDLGERSVTFTRGRC